MTTAGFRNTKEEGFRLQASGFSGSLKPIFIFFPDVSFNHQTFDLKNGGVPDFDGRQEILSSMPRIIGWPRKNPMTF